jgi:hypothetical protein
MLHTPRWTKAAGMVTRLLAYGLVAVCASRVHAQVVDEEASGQKITVLRGEYDVAPFVVGAEMPPGIGRVKGTAARSIVAGAGAHGRFHLLDEVYITLPAGRPATIGDRYVTIAEGPRIRALGLEVIPTGVLEIVGNATNGLARARILREFGSIILEQRFIPYESTIELPSQADRVDMHEDSAGTVAWVHQSPVLPSVQHYLIIKPRLNSGLKTGDEIALIDAGRAGERAGAQPPEPVAMARIVRVTPVEATAVIISVLQPAVRPGMSVRRVATTR